MLKNIMLLPMCLVYMHWDLYLPDLVVGVGMGVRGVDGGGEMMMWLAGELDVVVVVQG